MAGNKSNIQCTLRKKKKTLPLLVKWGMCPGGVRKISNVTELVKPHGNCPKIHSVLPHIRSEDTKLTTGEEYKWLPNGCHQHIRNTHKVTHQDSSIMVGFQACNTETVSFPRGHWC